MSVQRLKDVRLAEHIDETVEILAMLKDLRVAPMKKGGNFLTLVIIDQEKEQELVLFGVRADIAKAFSLGQVYHFTVNVKAYANGKDGVSAQLAEYQIAAQEDPSSYLMYEEGYQQAGERVFVVLQNIKDTVVGKVAYQALQENWDKFTVLPAAVSMHHVRTGGLLVHTANVLNISLLAAKHYQAWYKDARINMNLLSAGALLHDIGKVVEYEMLPNQAGAAYAGQGILTPHIISGISIITRVATEQGSVNSQPIQELIHLVASHHGRAEWGSAVEPHSIEADILSNADMLDATISRRVLINSGEPEGVGLSKKQGAQKFATYISKPELGNFQL